MRYVPRRVLHNSRVFHSSSDLQVSLVCKWFWFRVFAGMDDDADNRGPQHAPVKHVFVLKYVKDVSVGMLLRFGALDGLVHVGSQYLARGIDALQSVAREGIPKLLADQC